MIESAAMRTLPAIPDRSQVTSAGLEAIERNVAGAVGRISDLDTLEEWRAQAAALAAYLRVRNMAGPMLGAQRRVEARIGQLLGDPGPGRPTAGNPTRAEGLSRGGDRADFRDLARALNGEVEVGEEEWRASRRALVKLIRERLPATNGNEEARRHKPTREDRTGVKSMTAVVGNTLRGAMEVSNLARAGIVRTAEPETVEAWIQSLDEARNWLRRARAEIRKYQ